LQKIRKGLNDWQELEFYIAKHSQAEFSHGGGEIPGFRMRNSY